MTFLDYERIVREEVYFDWPLIAGAFGWQDFCASWQMEYSERIALIAILSALKPSVAIEVGTYTGGSLAALSKFSERAYSLDINPESSQFLAGKFPNVEYVIGDSKQTLPPILADLQEALSGPLFVLIDGDHTSAGVLADITTVLAFRPRFPMVVMGHDSFNPDCRRGMLQAEWTSNPHVHFVEIDFVHGSVLNRGVPRRQMWGGLFLALLLPQTRASTLLVSQRHRLLFDLAFQVSAHRPPSLARRIVRRLPLAQRFVRKVRRILGG
jgi:hypothetical protein